MHYAEHYTICVLCQLISFNTPEYYFYKCAFTNFTRHLPFLSYCPPHISSESLCLHHCLQCSCLVLITSNMTYAPSSLLSRVQGTDLWHPLCVPTAVSFVRSGSLATVRNEGLMHSCILESQVCALWMWRPDSSVYQRPRFLFLRVAFESQVINEQRCWSQYFLLEYISGAVVLRIANGRW